MIGNRVYNSGDCGILIRNISDDNSVMGNTIIDNLNRGIDINNCDRANIKGNYIKGYRFLIEIKNPYSLEEYGFYQLCIFLFK